MENLEIDAGVTYIDDAACERTVSVPLYLERYSLLTAVNGPFGKRAVITWREVAQLPLFLLTPDVRMRHTIDGLLREAGRNSKPIMEWDSTVLLLTHRAHRALVERLTGAASSHSRSYARPAARFHRGAGS